MAKLAISLRPVQLLLPALFPSWNFFDWIAPSPRIEYALIAPEQTVPDWQALRTRPVKLSVTATATRLFFNARWNEYLYLVSCAEHLCEHPTGHRIDQIFRRLAADLPPMPAGTRLQFRLVFVRRVGSDIEQETRFVSEAQLLSAIST